MVKLDKKSLDWAKYHILRQGDSDIFPRPFELDAIIAKWNTVTDYLLEEEIESYRWSGSRRLIIPKERHSFRVATQFDPLDSIVIAAIIHQYGSKIEEKRIPIEENKVFSYRFSPSSDGLLYNKSMDWYSFWSRSLEKAQSFEVIAITDITDFYNQIYHHTIQQRLNKTEIPTEITNLIMSLIAGPTAWVSRGIPIGPHTMHLLAEICLDPIDRSLSSNGYDYCRFVDDFHIFCKSKDEAEIAFFDLAKILDREERFVLNYNKTKIMDKETFIELAKKKLQDDPIDLIESNILDIIRTHSSGNPYLKIDISKLSPEELDSLNEGILEPLFESYLMKDFPDFIRIRWLIRRLAQIGVPSAIPFLICHLKELTPALGDIATYIASAEDSFEGQWEDIGKDLIQALSLPLVNNSEYLKLVIIDLFSKISDLDHIDYLIRDYDHSPPIIRRKIVKAVAKAGKDYWIREKREDFATADRWLRRAFIYGATALPEDEKIFWLNKIKKQDDILEKVIANWLLEGGALYRDIPDDEESEDRIPDWAKME